MKNIFNLSSVILLIFLAGIFQSCEKLSPDVKDKGKLEIAFDVSTDEGQLKSAAIDTAEANSYQILLSVADQNGVPVLEDELIPLYIFGSSFISQRIELEAGIFKLTKFMVIHPSGDVIFAAPLAGSPKSYLVNKPLPFDFVISAEEVTRVVPEVLAVVNESPEEFGYAAFGFHVVKPLPFYVMAVIYNSMTMDNSSIIAPTYATEARLTVYAPNGWSHRFKLEARVNKIEIRAGSEYYILVGEKEGFPPQKLRFTARELFSSSKERPIIIPFGKPQLHELVLKPGPRLGKDAMISNLDPDKNFGGHKYFEATFLSEPVLTVMRSNRSLIWFDTGQLPKSATIRKAMLTLYYDRPLSWNYDGGEDPASSVKPWYGAVLQQIVEPWEEYKLTWDTQPKTIEANQVFITPFNSSANFINIDVTRLYAPIDKINAPNYGMLFKLYPTELFPGFRFASSDFPEPRMHPELKIYYTLP